MKKLPHQQLPNPMLRNISINKALLFASVLLCWSCTRAKISVQTQYIDAQHLASFFVQTPDPRKYCPDVGQRLIVTWALPKEFLDFEDLHLELTIRFCDKEEDSIHIPVCKATGTYVYNLFNDDFFTYGGIAAYKVDLIGGGIILEQWRHQMWVDLIHLEKSD